MGNPKQKWTSEEEEALRAGVAKHGAGKWKNIQKDPEFNHLLFSRSNIDLKDKWRNLSVASGQLPRDKLKAPKPKAGQADAPATPLPIAQSSASVTASSQDASMDIVAVDSSKPVPEANNTSKYNEMIYEALSTLKEPNGSDCSTIASFIEQRQQVPSNFRRLISSRIRRLVQQDKLEKAENRYKIKGGAPLDTRSPKPPVQDPMPPPPPPQQQPKPPVLGIGYLGDTVEEAAVAAAYKIAEAENKSFVAAESVKEAERVAAIAEEMDALLQFALECYEKTEHGDIILNF
ncbi:single myb histone 4 [Phtheirospermum japonicum]|uniref:MYB transcription factor n=1 Tax=Phtheirospermum japonicum TaxID=374723 RepID=A0A830CXL3_9LAMI|nr:single myb histone 4 [Phtheirospermum japonicum]